LPHIRPKRSPKVRSKFYVRFSFERSKEKLGKRKISRWWVCFQKNILASDFDLLSKLLLDFKINLDSI